MGLSAPPSWLDRFRAELFVRFYRLPTVKRLITNRFHVLFYNDKHTQYGWRNASWLGVRALKNPLDLWVYQEILWELRPDVILECGTFQGGTALFLASICDQLQHGRVISIDIQPSEGLPSHPRIDYLSGSSTSPEVFAQVEAQIQPAEQVMVILDSDHRKMHVCEELRLYSRLVSPGQYLVVEDTNINGHPVHGRHGPGPKEAVDEFLKNDPAFEVDYSREKFLLSFNPGGFLKRKK